MNAITRPFGIEIEAFGITREAARLAVQNAGLAVQSDYDPPYTHRTTNYWKLVTDASVSGEGWEAVSPILRGMPGVDEAVKAAMALDAAGAEVDRSCGLHVHVDASDLSPEEINEILTRYARYETQIDAFMPLSRRENNNHYCRSVKDLLQNYTLGPLDRGVRTFLREFPDTGCGNSRRFYKINLVAYVRHGTLEFRHHSGTRNANKIKNWVLFVLHFVEECRQIVRRRNAAHIAARTAAPAPTMSTPTRIRDIDGSFRLSETQREILEHLLRGPQTVENLRQVRIQGGRMATAWTIVSYISEIRTACPDLRIKKNRRTGEYFIEGVAAVQAPAPTPVPAPVSIEPDTLFTGIPREVASFYMERMQDFAC